MRCLIYWSKAFQLMTKIIVVSLIYRIVQAKQTKDSLMLEQKRHMRIISIRNVANFLFSPHQAGIFQSTPGFLEFSPVNLTSQIIHIPAITLFFGLVLNICRFANKEIFFSKYRH